MVLVPFLCLLVCTVFTTERGCMPAPLDPIVKLGRENERLKIDNANLRSMNKKLLRRGGGYDDFITELRALASEDKFKFTSRTAKPFKAFDPSHEEIACVASSDLHLSETVSLLDSNGINVYNSVIAANRLWEHVRKVKSILTRHMQLYRISKIWVPMLGDMINGTIHSEQIYTNDLTDPAAVILCGRLYYVFLQELKGLGLPIELDTVIGNHPRMTVKMPTKKQAHTNLDWLVYEYLADRFRDDDQVTVTVNTSQIAVKKLYDWRYLFEHGLDIPNGKEEDVEDRLRAMFDDPIYRQATGMDGASFDQFLQGNLHKDKFLERSIVNGSYTGQNELGQSWRLKPIRPKQLMWGVSKKQVRTWQYGIDLSAVRSETADNAMSEYAIWYLKRYGKG
jgi:hypothetical protein